METEASTSRPVQRGWRARVGQLSESYGLVLVLIIVDYVVVSTLVGTTWGRVLSVFILGATLWITVRTSRARRIWQALALTYLVVSTLSAIVGALVPVPGADAALQAISILAGLLLLGTPFVILRRIISDKVVTTETVLGGVSVYLLLGFSFAFIYSGIALVSRPTPFFTGAPNTTLNDTLFFSYTTLTTVGYGNLVPAGSLGQSFAMLEALFGQIYLVLIVARLVSLWGQERPPRSSSQN
jgi:hypothetical protein